jgi:multicomponent Na+:H+ antiporter subunit D
MTASVVIPPVLLYVAGALLLPGLRGRLLKAAALLVPVAGILLLWATPDGSFGHVAFAGLDLVLAKVDPLSRAFGTIFHLITLLGLIFSLHHQERSHYAVALLYAGAAQGVAFAGDLFSLFVCWEGLTVAATFLIAARRTTQSREAAFRYLLVHVAGGLCLLTGIILHYGATGDIALAAMDLAAPGALFIFLGFGLNCAWPLLHAWLVDAYPEATVAGTVFLSAFTTKSAVYVLARTFAGTEALIWIGTAMAAFPVFYAIMENNLRRVLSYSLISQVGYMVVGIGIGTELAINGAVCHAWAHILYKSLLFMSMGAVLYRTGKIDATDLGGLWSSMPLTAVFCMIGGASIAAVPLFSGFVTKAMLMDAAAHAHLGAVWLVMLAASAGTFFYAGIKVPFQAFFSRDTGLRPKEAPTHMLLAMGAAAVLCIMLGVWPDLWTRIMPYYPVELPPPYTAVHVLGKLQLLLFTGLGFVLLRRLGLYPFESRSINLDVDWFYRRGGRCAYALAELVFNGLNDWGDRIFVRRIPALLARFFAEPGSNIQLGAARLVAGSSDRRETFENLETRIVRRSRAGVYPVGVGVLLAVFFLAVMSLLFLI